MSDSHEQLQNSQEPDSSLPVIEEPLDPANQALADAMRLSFRILKVVMLFLVVLYFFSGMFRVGPEEAGIILHLGRIVGDKSSQAREPGLHFAFPAPIDETILVSTKFRQEQIDTFYFKVSVQNRGADLDNMSGGLLQPGVDGSMLTGDRNIIHALWTVQYRVSDPVSFVKHVYDEGGHNARERAIVRALLENSLVAAVGHWDVETVIRGPLLEEQILEEARESMQQRLDALTTGLEVNWIKYVDHAPTPPLRVRSAFRKVLEAESKKLREIEIARQKANELLIGAAGENYGVLTDKLEGLEQARSKVSPEELGKMEEELGQLFGTHAGGEAIDRINRALSFATQVQQEIKADWDQFSRLLPEYKKNPVLVMRQQYWNVIPEILSKARKWYVTRGARLIIDMVPPSAWAREEAKRKYGTSNESAPR